jgi:hypothetical protein
MLTNNGSVAAFQLSPRTVKADGGTLKYKYTNRPLPP